ncbi:uncharacterized protein [Coffea arabica]|uniref:Uncharacterized protein isoform X11 n=1 Tax=Coffea arabica TaxID=13443 RepID=A0ABM4V1V1_COFAR
MEQVGGLSAHTELISHKCPWREMAPRNASFKKIILGSSSVARRQILSEMGFEFTVMVHLTADIDEKSVRKEKPEDLVMALAEAKADAIISRLKNTSYLGENEQPVLLITADTRCLKGLSEKNLLARKRLANISEVYFHEIPDDVIDNLIEEGIILNVSGALMLEHPLTLPFVDTVIGTADHVMGLSKALTEKLIQEAL